MNSVSIVGRLGQDPEVKKTNDGKSVATLRVAVSEGKDKTTWLTVVAWERSADLVSQYCRKGDQIGVNGRISVREYTTKEGDKRTATEIVASHVTLIGGGKQASGGGSGPYG